MSPAPRRKVRTVVLVALATIAASLAVMPGATPTQAAPPDANPFDVSRAIRYKADGTMIGSVIRSLVNIDDNAVIYPAPFTINFFDRPYNNLCITENGGVYPTNTLNNVVDASSDIIDAGCNAFYNQSTSLMAIGSQRPFISVLATDHMTGNDVFTTGSLRREYLSITGITKSGGASVITTSTAHGFTAGSTVTIAGTSGHNANFAVLASPAPTETTFAVTSGAAAEPAGGGYVNRRRVFGDLDRITASGGTVTVTTGANHGLGVGDYVTFAGTGIAAIDDKHFPVLTTNGAKEFTFSATGVPPDTDFVPGTDGKYKWFISDGYGAIGQLYFGETTVDGRQAMVVTYYRVPMYANQNPEVRFSTIQLVFVKKSSGKNFAAVGSFPGGMAYDFDIEFNYGTMTDDEDGYPAYSATQAESGGCGSWTGSKVTGVGSPGANCRWGIGWANYRTIEDAQRMKIEYCGNNKCTITLETASSHGLKAGDLVKFTDINTALPSVQGKLARTISGTSGNTILMMVPGFHAASAGLSDAPWTTIPTTSGTLLEVTDDYEIFPFTWIGDLVEQSTLTATRMTSNNMNAPDVPGRYTFQMIDGKTVGFEFPSMGRPSAPRNLTAYYFHYPYDPTKASVSWLPSSNSGGSAITSYTVTMSPNSGAPCVVNMPNALRCIFENLVDGVDYKFEVYATNSIGNSNVTVADVGWDPGPPPEPTTPTTEGGPFSEPKPFVLENGETPRARPGEILVFEGGEPVRVTSRPVTVNGVQSVRLGGTSAGGGNFEMTIGGDCPTCAVSQDNSGNNVLGMEQAAAVRVNGYGFGPGSQVNVFVSSTTRLIGFFKADGDGAFLGTVKVPTDLPRGNHTVQVSGFTADNVIRSVSVGITVNRATPSGCRVVRRKGKKPVTVCPKKPAAKKVVKKK